MIKFLFNKKVSLKHRIATLLLGSEYSMFMLGLVSDSKELLQDAEAMRSSIEDLEKMLDCPGGLYTTKYVRNVLWHIERDSESLAKNINEYMKNEVIYK